MTKHRRFLVAIISFLCIVLTVSCVFAEFIQQNLADLPAIIMEQIRLFFAIPIELDEGESSASVEMADETESITHTGVSEENGESSGSTAQGDWDIYQCNAVKDVNLAVVNLAEDSYASGSECDFNYEVTNNGKLPVRVLYYLYPNQTDELPPAWGWLKGGEIEPGDTWMMTIQDRFKNYVGQPFYAKGTGSMVFIYSVPECHWVTTGGIQVEITNIADYTLLASAFPCTEFSFDDLAISPDRINQGLEND